MVLKAGDHVCLARGPVKHHAIVVTDEKSDGSTEIVEFGVFDETGTKKLVAGHELVNMLSREKSEVRKNLVNTKEDKWKLVSYNRRDTTVKPAAEVVKAAMFLLEKGAAVLPAYHITFANGECVSHWCKTGKFESGQADKLYDSVNKAEKVARVLPVANAVKSKGTKTKASTSSSSSKTKGKAGAAAVAGVVAAVGTMLHNRQEKVEESWQKTNGLLDEAFAGYAH